MKSFHTGSHPSFPAFGFFLQLLFGGQVSAPVQKALLLPKGVLEGLCLSALYLLHMDGIQCARGLAVTAKPF